MQVTKMKELYVKHPRPLRENEHPIVSDEARIIYSDDFSQGNLDKWDIVDGSANIEKLDGTNVLSLSGYGGVVVQLDKITNSYCYMNLAISFMLEGGSSQLKIKTRDSVEFTMELPLDSSVVMPGKWFIANLAIPAPDLSESESPFNLVLTGNQDGTENAKAYVRKVELTQLPAHDDVTFEDDTWEELYTKNNAFTYTRESGVLTVKADNLPVAASSPLPLLQRKISLPGHPVPTLPMDGSSKFVQFEYFMGYTVAGKTGSKGVPLALWHLSAYTDGSIARELLYAGAAREEGVFYDWSSLPFNVEAGQDAAVTDTLLIGSDALYETADGEIMIKRIVFFRASTSIELDN